MRICVWPRVKSAEPCVRGEIPTSVVICADLLGAATVGPALVDRDLLADEVLVDRVGRLLDVRAGDRVLRVLDALGDRERQLDVLDDPAVEDVALAAT